MLQQERRRHGQHDPRQDELPELVEAVATLADIGVDALIIQDLGVYHLVREHFPTLELHASTQLAVHNRAGAEALKRLGFARVVLARELTFEEVRDITATAGIETEVAAVPAPGGDGPNAALDRVQQKVRALDDKWRQRERVISDVVKK